MSVTKDQLGAINAKQAKAIGRLEEQLRLYRRDSNTRYIAFCDCSTERAQALSKVEELKAIVKYLESKVFK